MILTNKGFDNNSTYFEHNLDSPSIPTVFIHGVGLDQTMWLPQKEYFQDNNVIFYDLLNHGLSKKGYKKLKFENFIDQLIQLVDFLKIKKFNLIGFSIGALIAQHFTSQHYEKVNKLIIIASIYKRSEEQKEKVKKYEDSRYKVTVTMYHPVAAQTDDTPNITADGTVIKIKTASDYNYVAVSRNMLKYYGGFLNYGDYIFLNAGVKSGVYQVRDTMAAHWINRVDILESPGTPPYKYNNASMRRVSFAMDEDHSS